ncbi:MAG: SDR family NAD(P)-dependent oxidoreductase [Myxococcota bacterium]
MTTVDYWVRHLREPVRFREGLATLFSEPVDAVVELGPRATSLALARAAVSTEAASRIAWLPTLRDGLREDVGIERALAELFVRGADLIGPSTKQIAPHKGPFLPGVRFRRSRHWFADKEEGRGVPHANEARPRLHTSVNHPLLGAAVDVPEPSAQRFESMLSPSAPAWLADHRVGQSVILPAAAFVELMMAAGRHHFGGAGVIELTDLTIDNALTFGTHAEVRLHTVATSTADEVRVRTFSADAKTSAGTWIAHAESRVRRSTLDTPLPQPPTFDAASERIVDLNQLWGAMGTAGLGYGDAFRRLVRLTVRRDAATDRQVALGVIRVAETIHDYHVPPTGLDACLQTIASLLEGSQTRLPVGVRRFIAWPQPGGWPKEVEVQTWLTDAPEATEASLVVRTRSGAPVAVVEGVKLAEVPGLAAPTDDRTHGLHQVEWIQRSRTGSMRVCLPDPSEVVDDLRASFADCLESAPLVAYRQGVAGLETRARAWARTIADQPEFERLSFAPESVKNQRLAARIRALAVEASSSPAPHTDLPMVATELTLLERCASRAVDVMAGRCDPISELLFPGGDSSALREIYGQAAGPNLMNAQVASIVDGALKALNRDEGVRILEIGAGTGATTEKILDGLSETRASYTLTDLGAPLVQAAVSRLGSRYSRLDGRVFDVSKDPTAQGFGDASIDIALAANVLHATPRLHETLAHVRQLLAPGGWLVLLEGTRPLGWLDLTFGLTDGWWCFEEDTFRTTYPLLDSDRWNAALMQAGFASVTSLAKGVAPLEQDIIVARAPEGSTARSVHIISGSARWPQLTSALRQGVVEGESKTSEGFDDGVIIAVQPDGRDAEIPAHSVDVVNEAITSTQDWLAAGVSDAIRRRLTFVTHRAVSVGTDGGWSSPSQTGVAEASLWGMARALRLERPELNIRVIDVGEDISTEALARELTAEDGEDEVALRDAGRFVPRLMPFVNQAQPTRLDVAVPGHLDQLTLRPLTRRAPKAGEVEIEVRATGLNFRDLLQALGLLGQGYAKELESKHIPFGFECAGEISRLGPGVDRFAVGDAVMGCLTPGSLASHVTLPSRLVVPKASALGWAQAAALPTVWLTVWYALDTLAELAPGDWILVHAAAGGVGTAAVKHALQRGARVIGTAHPSKWEHLRAMGVDHMASSRDVGFSKHIREWTNGAGVDVVLNCLTDELARASLSVTAASGRFVELGRRNGIDAETAQQLRPDVQYFAFDLGQLAIQDDDRLRPLIHRLADPDVSERLVLPTKAFPIEEAETAFRYLQASRHVGKLALVRESARAGVERIRSDGCYIISGGTGGLGLAIARWLGDRGARHLSLLCRRLPAPSEQSTIDALTDRGLQVEARVADITDRLALKTELAKLRRAGGPIRGVIHAAGVLDDGLLPDLDGTRVRRVVEPKVHGAHNLAEETAGDDLDFFVSFSSVAALLGSPGQANHAAANAVLDAHAAYLRGQERPGQSIAWGAWAQIGAAARRGAGDRLAAFGIHQIEPEDGLAAFADALQSGVPYFVVAPFDWTRFSAQSFAARPFFERRKKAMANRADARSKPMLDLSGMDASARRDALCEHLCAEIATVLDLDSPDAVEARGRLMDLGMDSLMAVELKTRLEQSLGLELQTTILFDHPTVEALVKYLDGVLSAADDSHDIEQTSAVMKAPSSTDDSDTIEDIESMSDEEVLLRLRG